MPPISDRSRLTDTLEISRILTGLWQVADIEKDGTTIDPDAGADWLAAYVAEGLDTFDMADHYGSAEIIAGRLLARRQGRTGRRRIRLYQMVPASPAR